MTEDRAGAGGGRDLGCRRPFAYILAIVALLVGVPAPLAGGVTLPFPIPLPGVGPANGQTGGTTPTPTPPYAPPPRSPGNPLGSRGMWIWYVSRSSGGSLSAIITKAKRYGVKTLLIKSSDGSSGWGQLSPALISTLHANGLKVCGWQYVYGAFPDAEARQGAAAVNKGADCLLIDAEGEYEGKYVEAQRYVTLLRKLIGANFPVALAGFPYVDYHPAFPYSVFLGPGGAQYNVPQMYWKDIGVSVDSVYAHTYRYNRIWGRPMYPLGQVYNAPPPSEIVRFRQLSLAYGAGSVSWWDWQESSNAGWAAVGQSIGRLAGFTPSPAVVNLGRGAKGDVVVWAQQHLRSAAQQVPVDGAFGAQTERAVLGLQTARGLLPTGVIDAATWSVLLRYPAAKVRWKKTTNGGATTAAAAGFTAVPKSASLPAVRNELARRRH
jgi:hypothetical protein